MKIGLVAQLARALVSHTRGQRFESSRAHQKINEKKDKLLLDQIFPTHLGR